MTDSAFGEVERVSNPPMKIGVDPINILCQNCNSGAGDRCTQPTNESRRPVPWFHLKREDDAREVDPNQCAPLLGWHVRRVCQHRA